MSCMHAFAICTCTCTCTATVSNISLVLEWMYACMSKWYNSLEWWSKTLSGTGGRLYDSNNMCMASINSDTTLWSLQHNYSTVMYLIVFFFVWVEPLHFRIHVRQKQCSQAAACSGVKRCRMHTACNELGAVLAYVEWQIFSHLWLTSL